MSLTPVPRFRLLSALVASAIILTGTQQATAESVSLTFDKTTGSAGVTVKAGSSTVSATPGPYYWHQTNAPAGSLYPNPTTTFCVELTQHISVGNNYTFTATPLASTPGVSSTEASLISKLYGAHYNTAWNNSGFAGSTDSTAFQLALWELVYDGNGSLNLGSGNFQVTSANSTALSTAASWLSGLGGVANNAFATRFGGNQLVWLSNPYKQDQITMIPCPPGGTVPAPPALLLGLIGIGGSLLGRRFRRKTAEAVQA